MLGFITSLRIIYPVLNFGFLYGKALHLYAQTERFRQKIVTSFDDEIRIGRAKVEFDECAEKKHGRLSLLPAPFAVIALMGGGAQAVFRRSDEFGIQRLRGGGEDGGERAKCQHERDNSFMSDTYTIPDVCLSELELIYFA